jgi:hypothetical protein
MSVQTTRPSDLQRYAMDNAQVQMLVEAMLRVEQWRNPTPIIIPSPQQSTGASTTATYDFEPPVSSSEDEWEIILLQISATTTFDNQDHIVISYRDELLNQNIDMQYQSFGVAQSGILGPSGGPVFPLASQSGVFAANYTQQGGQPIGTLIVKRKSTGESWRKIRVTLGTTATVGTRQWTVVALVRVRRRLLID